MSLPLKDNDSPSENNNNDNQSEVKLNIDKRISEGTKNSVPETLELQQLKQKQENQELNEINEEDEEDIDKQIQEQICKDDPNEEIKKKLMFEQKQISASKLFCHLCEKVEIIFLILGIIGSIGAGMAGPYMSLKFGGSISDFSQTSDSNNQGVTPEMMAEMFKLFQKKVDDMVYQFLYIGVGCFVAGFLMNCMWSLLGLRQTHHLKERYFDIILKQEQGWFDANNAYEFSTKVQAQIEQIELGLGDKLGNIIQLCVQLIAGLIIAFTSSWKLTLIMLCVAPGIFLCLMFLLTSMKKVMVASRKTYEFAGGIAEELLYNIKTVASFVNFEYEKKRFGMYIDKVTEFEDEKAWKLGVSIAGLIFFLNLSFMAAILFARNLIADKEYNSNTGEPFQAGDVLTVIMSALMAIMSIGGVAPNFKIIQEAASASSDYFTLLERKVLIDTSESTYKPNRDEVKGKIEFKDISFIYPSDENKKKILDGLSFVVEPGQKVALVGESGCGKSTTVNLIERLYEPESGDVLIDDVSVKNYDLEYLRTLIGYVQQEPVLFNKSIKFNLLFGREELVKELGDPDQLIKEACDDAYASEFIEMNKEKYDYIVGIKGSKLSGGQKQRIAIARAILCKPKILILDEATSALDNKSEKEVQKALDHISQKNVSTVIIAHRLSTIKNADKIYAIKSGKIIESGTHDELLALNGYYAGLVKSQLGQDAEEHEEAMAKRKLSRRRSSIMEQARKLSLVNGLEANIAINPEAEIKKVDEKEKKVEEVKMNRGALISLISDHKFTIFVASFSSFICGALTPVQGYVLAHCVNALSEPEPDDIKSKGLFWGLMFLALAAGNSLFTFLKLWRFIKIGNIIVTKMRKQVLEKYLELHLGYFDEDGNSPGALLTKLSIDSTQMNSLVLSIFGDIATVTGVIICGFALGFYFSWRLTLINLCFIPFTVTAQVLNVYTKHGGRAADKKINIEAGSVLSECVINTKTIYSFNFQKPAVKMYLDILDESKKDFVRDSILKGLLLGLGAFAMYASMATVFHYAFVFIRKGLLEYTKMNVSMNVVIQLGTGISQGLMGVADYPKAKRAFISVFSTLNTESLIDTREEANKDKIGGENIKGKIEFKNVSFAYPTKPDQMILKGISFVIEPGQAAALVGYSGCGKSTIIQLLERYYDPTDGEILIDGVNIKDYSLLELRKKIGLVSQEPVLFKRSVYKNILYGKLDSTKEEVLEAANRACISKFVNKSNLGTKEDPVSGGEKQRIAIARAFLKDPVILLLDEATSALDKESEIEVQKSIYELQKNRTSISVAHRLSTIENSDVIFVLEHGKIVEKGTHKELLQLGGKYATLSKYSEQ